MSYSLVGFSSALIQLWNFVDVCSSVDCNTTCWCVFRFDSLQQAFQNIDADNSGKIDCKEFPTILMANGIKLSPAAKDALYKAFDKNNDGQISLVCVPHPTTPLLLSIFCIEILA